MSIRYVDGDATQPPGKDRRLIAHLCNDAGGWGAGFVTALSKRWPDPQMAYHRWHRDWEWDGHPFELGRIQTILVEENLYVCNMIALEGFREVDGIPPIRYKALRECLTSLSQVCAILEASVHMPRIACGLARGSWDEVEPIINETLISDGVAVTVYDVHEGK